MPCCKRSLLLVLADAAIVAFTAGPGGTTLAMGLMSAARSGDVATLHRWSLGLAVAPCVVGVVMVLRGRGRR